jgi:hypothetical protein
MTCENEKDLRKALLLLPRSERAKAQDMRDEFLINTIPVKRLTRRYWQVSGNEVLLNKAMERIPIAEAQG